MKNKQLIKLSEIFSEKINSRSSIKIIFEKLDGNRYVTIDFSDILFISRAAAHELVVLLESYQNKGYSISLDNVASSVHQMINAVSESRKVDYKKATFINRIKFGSDKEMSAFLLSF